MALERFQNILGNNMPDEIHQLAFNKQPGELFTDIELAIMDEWDSGIADSLMKISIADPNLFNYMGLYDDLEKRKSKVWANVPKPK